MKLTVGLLLCFAFVALGSQKKSPSDLEYFRAEVFRVTPRTLSHLRYLNGLSRSSQFSFWNHPRGKDIPVDIMAHRWQVSSLKATLQKLKIPFEVTIKDLRQVIRQHLKENQNALDKAHREGKAMDWTAYHDYDEIMDWLDSLAVTYPSLVTVEDIGTSYEGRTMKMVKVSTGGEGKPSMFVDGGMHAREWISPATVTYMMNELLSNSADYQDILDSIDLIFVPVINADGYAYTWTDDRMWRKTRSDNPDSSCYGVDPNRNWNFHWMESGASDKPCSDIYAGAEPFSEPETRNLRDQMLKYASTTPIYVTYHSYSQVWLYPWGYAAIDCDDWEDLAALANAGADALEAVYGTKYEVGGSGTLLYPAAGASDDYAKGCGGIKYSYTVELRDTGKDGFELPPDQITPTGIETWESFKVLMNFVKDNYAKGWVNDIKPLADCSEVP